MASRRRRRTVTWFPSIGTSAGEGEDDASGREFTVSVPADGTTNVVITALTFDEPKGDDNSSITETSLSDIIGSSYMLRRIVGKLYAAHNGSLTTDHNAVLFAGGFFVARAADDSQATGSDQPIGSQSISERQENYNPLSVDCIREPWIWRRVWLLGNTNATLQGVSRLPVTTGGFGSVQDGPHIDAQTMRRVTSDERLWFVVAARSFPVGSTLEDTSVQGYLDFRILGSIMKDRNRGVF